MIPKTWAEKIANSQDIGGETRDKFIRILMNAPDDRGIDPISDIIINAVLDADGEDDADKVSDMLSTLEYSRNMIRRAEKVIANFIQHEEIHHLD